MMIEVTGMGFGNKGGELLLAAVQQAVVRALPSAEFAVGAWAGPYAWRARHGLYTRWDPSSGGRRLRWIDRLMTAPLRARYGLVAGDEVSALLDSSGYAFGDPWRTDWIEAAAKRFEQVRAAGRPVVLLPQTFGPFEQPDVAAASARVLRAASRVYARDELSRSHVEALCPELGNVREAPDITLGVAGHQPAGVALPPRAVAIVPNAKMTEQGSAAQRAAYVPFLARAVRACREAGFAPLLVLHETAADRRVADEIRAAVTGDLPVVAEADPLALKGLLGECRGVVASRFHALVGALSQGVPALGTSWSHKYEQLFASFGCPEALVASTGPDEALAAWLDRLRDDRVRAQQAERLRTRAAALVSSVRAMWADVIGLLREGAA